MCKKLTVYCEDRGVRTLKEGVTLEQYQVKHPDAIKVRKPPCESKLMAWANDGGCEAVDGCWTEPDGTCEHGLPSWMLALNMI